MKATRAILNFFKKAGNNPSLIYQPVSVLELREFKQACTPQEWNDFGRVACAEIGEPFEESTE